MSIPPVLENPLLEPVLISLADYKPPPCHAGSRLVRDLDARALKAVPMLISEISRLRAALLDSRSRRSSLVRRIQQLEDDFKELGERAHAATEILSAPGRQPLEP